MPGLGQGWGDVVMSGLFGDAGQEAKDFAESQNQKNRAAAGMDANGNLLPQPAANAQPGIGSGQIAPAAPPPGTIPAGQEPNATKTPQSWGSIIMDLTRQEEAAAGFNQALGMAGAAISRPENRERATNMFKYPYVDPMKLGQTLQNSSSQQQGQDRMNAIGQMIMDPQRGPALATSLNIPWEQLKARFQADPAGVGQMVQNYGAPTDDLKNLQQIQRMQGAGTSNKTLDDASAQLVGKIGGQQAMSLAQADWDKNHPNEPMPWTRNDPNSFATYQTEQNEISKVRTEALTQKSQNSRLFYDLQNRTEELKSMPGMSELLDDNGQTGQAKRQFAQHILETTSSDWATELANYAGMSPAERQFISAVKQLKGQQYAQAIQQLPNRFSQQEADRLSQSLGQIGNIGLFSPSPKLDPKTGKPLIGPDGQPVMNKGSDAYIAQAVNPLGENVRGFRANNIYGASGETSDMPTELRPYMSQDYLNKGKLHVKGMTEDWENTVNATPEVITAAQNLIKNNGYTRSQADRYVRRHGMRPPINGYGD